MVGDWVWRATLALTVLLAGCSAGAREARVASSFSGLYSCSIDQIAVTHEVGGLRATGCGKSARYDCFVDGCQRADDPPEPRAEGAADTERITGLRLIIPLQGGDALFFTAWPQETEEAEVSLDDYPRRGCEVELMVDGQRLELVEGASKGSRVLPRDVMLDLTVAQQLAVRSCNRRWSLDAKDLRDLRRFAARYAEELAWQGNPRKGGSGGRRAPAGGWQSWQVLGAFPAAAPVEATLAGTQLFQKLAPSVWRVEGKLASGFEQGSAVAVTKSLLVTNCHVVEGALKIVVKQGKTEAVAKLNSSDPVKDRCVLEVADATLTPVVGVRPYVDLKVGEPLYTLGAPSGFDLTLANGILSGLREDQGVRYVQTTSPISPGSSGGGLFDARGNLVGITTLVIAGKERLNQSLNFAIAAEMFWSP